MHFEGVAEKLKKDSNIEISGGNIIMKYLLGIDIGTSGTKTILFNETLESIASATYEYPLTQIKPLWAEQNPSDWWGAVVEGIKEVINKSGVSPQSIASIGLSGQMHGLVLLNKDNKIIRPSIIWCDQRTVKECNQITEIIGHEKLIDITANPALTSFTLSKILWIKNNEPASYKEIAHILLPKDYIRFKLTGQYATDVSDASGMQLLNIKNRCWSDEIITKFEIDKNWLGKVYESQEITGYINEECALETGLAISTSVVGGAGDQAAAAIGCGIVREGRISDTIGTSGVIFAHTDKPLIDYKGRVHTFCHAVPNKWHIMGVTQGAGLSLKWFRDNFCQDLEYKEMDSLAESIPICSEGLIFLPYLMGERSPILDPEAKGVFFGLTNSHKRTHMIRSVMEGIVLSQYDCLKVVNELGVHAKEITIGGGGAKSHLFRQMFADCFNTPVITLNNTEGGALGAAILAGTGAGIFNSIEEACDSLLIKSTEEKPINCVYENLYLKYKALYNAVKGL